MVYNNVAIAESFKKSYGLNSLLQKRVTLKEEGGGGGAGWECTKNWQIPKYRVEKSTKYRYLIYSYDRSLKLI